jgi:hypothetical protein
MPVPTCSEDVAASADAAATSGAGTQPSYQKWCSAIQSEWKPRASVSCASSRSCEYSRGHAAG